ncbi:MAG: CmcJ/NvfI family oxidoreductase, partial [Stellaceae bacterium]
MSDTTDRAPPFVDTSMAYIDPAYGPTIIYEYKRDATTHHYDPRPVRVHNARIEPDLSLDRNGFTLVEHRTAVADFHDADQVKRVYYPEIERVVKALTGAEKVLIFGDVLRSDASDLKPLVAPDPGPDGARVFSDSAIGKGTVPPMQIHETANNPHIDFNEKTVRRMAAAMLGDEAEKYAGKRVMMINLWRGITP